MTEYHPSTFLYGSVTAEDAAQIWRDEAIKVAKEYNAVNDELQRIKRSWPYRLFKRWM